MDLFLTRLDGRVNPRITSGDGHDDWASRFPVRHARLKATAVRFDFAGQGARH
jgi:hypothetical protein